uniref:uncharacterized protein LOC127064116 n=1 Tax=Vespula vulgaris TaxID=7454 RepID=UPI00223ADD70|nr:uncharacterized protein LOC127064116 [Vespula vulgaris]
MTQNRLRSHKEIILMENLINESEISRIGCNSKVCLKLRKTKKSKLGLRKCHSAAIPRYKTLKGSTDYETLKIPKIPQQVFRIISILRHEKFLKMVTYYFRSSFKNHGKDRSKP